MLALFNGTRGLFTGWLKGVVMLALTPLFAVLSGGIMLEMSIPVLSALNQNPGNVDPRAAVGFFMIGAVHVALMVMVLKTAATMVSGWRVFGLVPERGADATPQQGVVASGPAIVSTGQPAVLSTAQAAGMASQRRQIATSGVMPAPPANANEAGGGAGAASTRRKTRVYATTSGGGQVQPLTAGPSRVKGVGSRFRAPAARVSEKFK